MNHLPGAHGDVGVLYVSAADVMSLSELVLRLSATPVISADVYHNASDVVLNVHIEADNPDLVAEVLGPVAVKDTPVKSGRIHRERRGTFSGHPARIVAIVEPDAS